MATETTPREELRARFAEDGVVHLRQALSSEWIKLIEQGVNRNFANPGPLHKTLYAGTDREIYQDMVNYGSVAEFRVLMHDSPIVDIFADVLDSENLWFYYDQVWLKEGGEGRRTPWHQDLSYWDLRGSQYAVFWVTLDPVSAEQSLEFVRGSHRGPLYSATAADRDAADDTTPLFESMPRLPDIQAHREDYDIVSFAIEPGDVVMFHPGMLHGGGASSARRRTLSIRLFGDDVVYEPFDGEPNPPIYGLSERLKPGDPPRSAWFPQVYPRPTYGVL